MSFSPEAPYLGFIEREISIFDLVEIFYVLFQHDVHFDWHHPEGLIGPKLYLYWQDGARYRSCSHTI